MCLQHPVALLHQHRTENRSILAGVADRAEIRNHDTQVGLRGEDRSGTVVDRGSDDGFDKSGDDRTRGFVIEPSIQSDDAAECGQ